MATQTFTSFGPSVIAEYGFQNGDHEVSNTESGVTFTISTALANTDEFQIYAGQSWVGAAQTGSTGAGTNSYTITWTNGVGGSQASSVVIAAGINYSDMYLLTSGGSNGGSVNVAGLPISPGVGLVFNSAQVTGIKFVLSGDGDSANISTLGLSINCFVADTMIATPTGPKAVQTLMADDKISTANGGETTVKWLGEQPVNTTFNHPAKVNPIRITAGALGNGLPTRDLLLSQDHAIHIDGVLYNAGTLVNGTTIHQEATMPKDGFTYYHVETDAHELLLANGVAAETFIDYAGRDSFVNGADSTAHVTEMPLPRISSARLVPISLRDRLKHSTAA